MGNCVETTLTNIHNPVDSLFGIGGVDKILTNRMIESQKNKSLHTNMTVKSPLGPLEKVDPIDLPVLAEGSLYVSLSQLIPGAALECEVNPTSAIPDT